MIKFQRLITTLLSAISLLSAVYGQGERQRIVSYINQYKELAISEMLRTGVPASVTLAQGILETAGGQSDLAAEGNNHFGIKCKSDWTGESMLHDDDARNECFRKYGSVEESYRDHSNFLRSRPAYAFLFKLDPTDYEGWAKGLKKAGYATNSAYAQSLIRLIVENGLQDYTLVALQRKEMGDEFLVTHKLEKDEDISETSARQVFKERRNSGINKSARNEGYPVNSVFNINETKVVYAEAGTSLLALANNYNVSFKKLLEYNDLDETDILNNNELVYLEKKSKRGTKEFHIVKENETMRDISQKEGIQLSTLLDYNGLQKGMEPAPGEKVYLKYPSPTLPRLVSVTGVDNPTASIMK